MIYFQKNSKLVFWWVIEHMPTGLAKKVLQAIKGRDYIKAALWNGRLKLAATFQLEHIIYAGEKSDWAGILLIGGPARIGKSIIAVRVAEKLGAFVVKMDEMRHFYDVPDNNERQRIKKYILHQLCAKGRGLVIEGDELITDNRPRSSSEKIEDKEITLDILVELKNRYGVIGITLGAAENQAEDKARSILSAGEDGNCWATNKLTQDQIVELARLIISLSRRLEAQSHQHRIPHYKINCHTFDDSIVDICDRIVSNMTRCPRQF